MLNKRSNRYLLVIVFVAITQVILYWVTQPPKLKDLGGIPVSIIDALQPKEKIYAINFFATWCGACKQEHNLLLYLAKELKLPIYGIVLHDSESNVERFLAQEGNPYKKLVIDFPIKVPELLILNITNIPCTLLVADGRVFYNQKGPFNKLVIQQNIIPLLAQIKQ